KPQQRVGQRRNTTSGISGCCAAHCTWLRLPRSWTWSGVPRRCSSAARWHGYQVSQRAFANREQGGDARRRGVRLDGCACDIRADQLSEYQLLVWLPVPVGQDAGAMTADVHNHDRLDDWWFATTLQTCSEMHGGPMFISSR